MTQRGPHPRLDRVPEDVVGRVLMTISCSDAGAIPKVERAGETAIHDGIPVQIMHNGLIVEEGCYYGPWMTEIIRSLRGHHEPQEELVFDRVIDRLRATADEPSMIEFGSFWCYYGIWFARALPGAKVVALEPDPEYLSVGIRNVELNGLGTRFQFVHGSVGAHPGEVAPFVAESDSASYPLVQYDLRSLMSETGVDRADLVLADIQGAETALLDRARDDLLGGRVRFLMVSTHHHSISGSAVTHQHALELLRETGAHIIAEHTVPESYSGDGLIAASFDDRDKDFAVEVSHARAKDSLFGELEPALEDARRRATDLEREADSLRAKLDEMRAESVTSSTTPGGPERPAFQQWLRAPQRVVGRLRRHRGGDDRDGHQASGSSSSNTEGET